MDNPKRKRSAWHQARIVVLLPFTIFLWMTGWTLCMLDAQRTSSRTDKKQNVNEAPPKRILA